MLVGDKVSYLLAKDFVILAFILVVDFSFDIEEIGASLLAALPTMPLGGQLARRWGRQQTTRGAKGTLTC